MRRGSRPAAHSCTRAPRSAAAFVVALTPLAIYGLQVALGAWPEGMDYRDYHRLIDWRWLLMELGTLAVGAVMLWRYPLPFLVMPVAVTLRPTWEAVLVLTGASLAVSTSKLAQCHPSVAWLLPPCLHSKPARSAAVMPALLTGAIRSTPSIFTLCDVPEWISSTV
jgi:hypothetical protein